MFLFTEQQMKDALHANYYRPGWRVEEWVPPGVNPDYCSMTLEEAFKHLLEKANIL